MEKDKSWKKRELKEQSEKGENGGRGLVVLQGSQCTVLYGTENDIIVQYNAGHYSAGQ